MRKIAIVDDEQASHQHLADYALRYAKECEEHLELIQFESGVQFLEQYTPDFELVFLDIEMPGMDGMQTARELRGMDENSAPMLMTP